VSRFPWGAHYLPIVGESLPELRAFLQECGVITRYRGGLPEYDEYALCAELEERLLVDGRWQEGIVPATGLREDDHAQLRAFFARMAAYREARGADGRPLFSIPVDASSTAARDLDAVSMDTWMRREGFGSPALHWYVNYACRDDFGLPSRETSAWAGIHYFASRRGAAANAPAGSVLTWPEGNGFLVAKLHAAVAPGVRTGVIVSDVRQHRSGVAVRCRDARRGETYEIEAGAAVVATPRFVAAHIVADLRETRPAYLSRFQYAPWLVANVTVDRMPAGLGAGPAWDNVSMRGESLGYVVATHQSLQARALRTVLTYYRPMTGGTPQRERELARRRTLAEWQRLVTGDLLAMNPELRGAISRVDVWFWAHAMVRPEVGFMWGRARAEALTPLGRIFFGHSDMSGMSLFEEAFVRGTDAGRRAAAAAS
jgi:hypothetical protein